MKTAAFRSPRPIGVLLGLAAAWASAGAPAAGKSDVDAAQARCQQDRAAFNGGTSNQDRATCLREAGAAQAEARRRGPDDGAAACDGNAGKRCEPLPDEDCEA